MKTACKLGLGVLCLGVFASGAHAERFVHDVDDSVYVEDILGFQGGFLHGGTWSAPQWWSDSDLWLAMFDHDGQEVWKQRLDLPGDWFGAEIVRSGSALYFCGTHYLSGGRAAVHAFDKQGQPLWTHEYGHSLYDTACRDIAPAPALDYLGGGTVVATGAGRLSPQRPRGAWVATIDGQGQPVWQTFLGLGRAELEPDAILSLSDGDVVVSGGLFDDSWMLFPQLFVARLDGASGALEWIRFYPHLQTQWYTLGLEIKEEWNGALTVVGTFENFAEARGFALRLSANNGAIMGQRYLYTHVWDVHADADGWILGGGEPGAGQGLVQLTRLDEAFTIEWSREWPVPSFISVLTPAVAQDNGGFQAVLGVINPTGPGQFLHTIRSDAQGDAECDGEDRQIDVTVGSFIAAPVGVSQYPVKGVAFLPTQPEPADWERYDLCP